MKITIELDDRDWGKVQIAMQRYVNNTYNDTDSLRAQSEVATLARIRDSIRNQRREATLKRELRKEPKNG